MVQKREPGACRNMIGYSSHQYSQQGYNKLFTQVTNFNRSANIVLLLLFSFVETKFCAVNCVCFGNVRFNGAPQQRNKPKALLLEDTVIFTDNHIMHE